MIEVMKLHHDAVIPVTANPTDAGYDLTAIADAIIPTLGRSVVGTGIAVAIPSGHVGLIWPRSGLAVKSGGNVLAGVIDSGYRGEVKVALHHTDYETDVVIRKGDRIAQLLVQPVVTLPMVEVGQLSDSDRGENGFGSTGA